MTSIENDYNIDLFNKLLEEGDNYKGNKDINNKTYTNIEDNSVNSSINIEDNYKAVDKTKEDKDVSINKEGNNDTDDKDNNNKGNSKRSFVRNVDENIIAELVDTAMEDDNEKVYAVNMSFTKDNHNSNIGDKNVIMFNYFGVNKSNQYVVRGNENYIDYDESKLSFTLPSCEFLKGIEGRRNLYMLNDYRGIFKYKFESIYEDSFFKINCANYIFTPTYGKLTYCSNYCNHEHGHILNTEDEFTFIDLNLFNYARVYDYLKEVEERYIVEECKKTKFVGYRGNIINKYKILTIPKDIMKLFRNITADYEEALKHLFLDDKIGYYCYKYDDTTSVPVICKHQIMLLQGINPIDIADECYKNGICKYCGQDMIAYNQVETLTLPPSATSMIITFSECFKVSISADAIIHIVTDFIIKRFNKTGINIYSNDECIGYTALYILKMVQICKKAFSLIDYKLKALMKKISNHLAYLGKSDNDVKQILEDDSIFGDINNIVVSIKSELQKNDKSSNNENILPEDALFNSTTNRTPTTDIQKLYIKDKRNMYKLFEFFRKAYNKLYNFNYLKYDYSDKATFKPITMKQINGSMGLKFFQQVFKHYCPVNRIHEFKGSNCVHCGIDKEGKNLEQIYNKYNEIINNITIEEPNILTFNVESKKKKDIKEVITQIQTSDINDFNDIMKRYNINYTETTYIDNKMKKINDEFNKSVVMLLDIDYNEFVNNLPKDNLNTFIKKVFKYIINRKLEKEEVMVNNIYIYYYDYELTQIFYLL